MPRLNEAAYGRLLRAMGKDGQLSSVITACLLIYLAVTEKKYRKI
jgi:hypothetical protein